MGTGKQDLRTIGNFFEKNTYYSEKCVKALLVLHILGINVSLRYHFLNLTTWIFKSQSLFLFRRFILYASNLQINLLISSISEYSFLDHLRLSSHFIWCHPGALFIIWISDVLLIYPNKFLGMSFLRNIRWLHTNPIENLLWAFIYIQAAELKMARSAMPIYDFFLRSCKLFKLEVVF